MKSVLRVLTNRWFLAALGLTAIGLVIWFIGPLIGFAESRPLESSLTRAIVIMVIVMAWLVFALIRALRSQRASAELAQGITEQDAAAEQDQRRPSEDAQQLRAQFDEAITLLKKSKGGGSLNLHALPWYVIVGPPGSGKTTALVNSGLHFPLADRFGDKALRGVGGTRNCDWWFTNDAILLDTAGRYVTQDSDSDADRAEWLSFLDLLKKHRRRRPINGVMVAISISDILQMASEDRLRQVTSIRQRVQELYDHLGIRVPVYVLLTKSDLLAGFVEFFEDLSREEREQVWGMTFQAEESDAHDALHQFDVEFDRLVERLNERVLERVSRERDHIRRGLVYDFPAQVANIKGILKKFLDDVFSGSRYETTPYIRGVYFTSGTQEGTPVDRLVGTVSRGFGIDIASLPAFRGQGRAFFVHRLLKDVLFRESELAGTNRRFERRRALVQAGVATAAIVVAGIAILGWLVSYYGNRDLTQQAAVSAAAAETSLSTLNERSQLLNDVLPALNEVRDLPGGYAARDDDIPITLGLGLYQGDKLGDQARITYRRLLLDQLLPRLMLDLEEQVARSGESTEFRYEALKRYLMLDSKDHYDAASIVGWFRQVWAADFARNMSSEQMQQLFGHLDALFATRPEPLPLPLDDALVARARAEQLRVPVEERAYGRIKRAPVEDLRGFSIMTAAGSDAGIVFVRKSGAGLREETPPLYTRDGYFKIFLPGATQIASNLLEEQWVLGENAGAGALGDTAATTERIRELYLRDYAQTYEELLLDLDLAPFGTPQQASTILRVLSADESPLLKLLTAVRDETNLQDSVDVEQIAEATEEIAAQQQQLAGILNRTRVGSGINRAVERMSHVQRRFDSLHELVPEDGDGPMTRVLELLRELYEFMNLVARQGDSLPAHMAESGEASIQQLENEAAGQPAFLENIMSSAASQTSRVAFGGVANYINDEWNARAAGFCRDAIAGRYPIDRNSSREIQLQDFAEFFGPDGIMQSFFDTFLAEYVDASRRPWRVKSARATAFSLQPDALGQFERARAIREVFFKGGSGPAVSFELRPERLDASLEEFSMSLGGKRIVYRSGPRFAEVMNWPGGDGATAVQIQMLPAGPSGRTMIEERGPWAWFRILDQASIQPTSNPETFTVQFTLDGRTASYELAARSAFNPFDLPELGEFSCPKSL